MTTAPGVRLRIDPGFRLQWEEAQQAHVLLYPEGMITLNSSSAEILKRCDGTLTAEDIIASLENQFPGVDLASDVREFLDVAQSNGWVRGIPN